METLAVIGAMYGDEGKGLATDYFCSKFLKNSEPERAAVVRFQGGSQSGHTVVTPEGTHHIFSHFGSGTLLGVKTILGKDFVCNPGAFLSELSDLKTQTWNDQPPVYVDERCYITTPYDILLNRAIENSRGNTAHSSVGVGFGETIERNEVANIRLVYGDILHKPNAVIIEAIKKYTSNRLKLLGIEDTTNSISFTKFTKDLISFRDLTRPLNRSVIKDNDFLVLEGGQGLWLDMVYGEYPYVTRSRTGLTCAKSFCSENSIKLDKVVYVSRAYCTRHGNGSLSFEQSVSDYPNFSDSTNTHNEFQGKFRIAPLDFSMLKRGIYRDSWDFGGDVSQFFTCIDHLPYQVRTPNLPKGTIGYMERELFIKHLKDLAHYLSNGPTRNNVAEVTNAKS